MSSLADIANQLLHAPQFLITWTIFFGCGLIIFSLYVIKTNKKFVFKELWDHCVPFNVFTDKSFHADVIIYLIGKVVDGFILIPAVLINIFVCTHLSQALHSAFPAYNHVDFSMLSAAFCTIIMFIFVEFSDFMWHFAAHKIPFLWELHKVHHSAQSLNPLTSKRGHPLDVGFAGVTRGTITAIPSGVFVFLFDISIVEAAALSMVASKIFIIATLDPLKHSHHPISLGFFDRILISPHMHQIHHSKSQAHWDKNFGTNLSIFDWLFGVAYRPSKGEKAVFGISGLSDATLKKYNTLYGAYIAPMLKSYRKARKMLIKSTESSAKIERKAS